MFQLFTHTSLFSHLNMQTGQILSLIHNRMLVDISIFQNIDIVPVNTSTSILWRWVIPHTSLQGYYQIFGYLPVWEVNMESRKIFISFYIWVKWNMFKSGSYFFLWKQFVHILSLFFYWPVGIVHMDLWECFLYNKEIRGVFLLHQRFSKFSMYQNHLEDLLFIH